MIASKAPSRPRTGEWLAAALVVVGLFLLHGMTADHDMPVPAMSGATMTSHGDSADHGSAGAAATEAVAAASPTDHAHAMAGSCLALLGGVLILRLRGVVGRARLRAVASSSGLSRALARCRLRPPRLFTPSLHQLRIART